MPIHNGELKLALRRIAEIRLQLEIQRDVDRLFELADAVLSAGWACVESAKHFEELEEKENTR